MKLYPNSVSLLLLVFISTIAYGAESTLRVDKLQGTATIDGKPASIGDVVKEGSVIISSNAEKDFIDVKSSEHHHLRLAGGTLTFENISKKFELQLKNGTLFAHVNKLDKDQSFNVKTTNSIAGIRGTKFFIMDEPTYSYLCVCEGKVTHEPKNKPEERRIVSAGEDHHIYAEKMITTPMKSPQMFTIVKDTFKSMGYRFESDSKKMRGGR
jgi:hypothetical protein